MKNVFSYVLGLLVISAAAHAAPASPAQTASRMVPRTGVVTADRKAVSLARVKLMNDVRKLGPDAPQVAADKEALIQALGKLQSDSQGEKGGARPVNVKRMPRKVAHSRTAHGKRPRKTKSVIGKARSPRSTRKVSHRHARKPARVA